MGKIIKNIFSWTDEELRQELCIEYEQSDLLYLKISLIKAKFRTIEKMMNKQLEAHKTWEKCKS